MDGYRSALHVRSSNPWREAGSPQLIQNDTSRPNVPSCQHDVTGQTLPGHHAGTTTGNSNSHGPVAATGGSTGQQPGRLGLNASATTPCGQVASTAAGSECAQTLQGLLLQQGQQAQLPSTAAAPQAQLRPTVTDTGSLAGFSMNQPGNHHQFCQQGQGSRQPFEGGGSSHIQLQPQQQPQQPQHQPQQHPQQQPQQQPQQPQQAHQWRSPAMCAGMNRPVQSTYSHPQQQHSAPVCHVQKPHMVGSYGHPSHQIMQPQHQKVQQRMLQQNNLQMQPQQQQVQLQVHQQAMPMFRAHSSSVAHPHNAPAVQPYNALPQLPTAHHNSALTAPPGAAVTATYRPIASSLLLFPQQHIRGQPISHSAPARNTFVPTKPPVAQLHFTAAQRPLSTATSSTRHPSCTPQHPSMHGMAVHHHSQPLAPSSALNLLPTMHAPRGLNMTSQHAAVGAAERSHQISQGAHFNPQHAQRSQAAQYTSQRPVAMSAAAPSVQPASERPYDTCPGVFTHCGGELHLLRQNDGPEMWVCRSCGHMSCGVAQENDVKLALELIETTVQPSIVVSTAAGTDENGPSGAACTDSKPQDEPCGDQQSLETADGREKAAVATTGAVSEQQNSTEVRKVVQVVVRPLAKSRQAVRIEGGVLNVICRRQGHAVTSALQSSPEEAVFPFELLPRLRERLKVCPSTVKMSCCDAGCTITRA